MFIYKVFLNLTASCQMLDYCFYVLIAILFVALVIYNYKVGHYLLFLTYLGGF